MTREWQPGDVAMVRGDVCVRLANGLWEHGRPDQFAYNEPAARPVVVIDPEDTVAVERLVTLFFNQFPAARQPEDDDDMQAALREFADPTPPKPAEPTGLGAVVVDLDGSQLVRVENSTHPWRASGGHRFAWEDIDHLRTLSDGVEPLADWEIDLLRGQS